MFDLNKLCNDLNNKVFGYEVLEVVKERGDMVIKVKKTMTSKFVKKHLLDDLITFFNGKAQMTLRLQDYAIELSNGQVVVTKDLLFY